jgi:hypothetical protein
MAKQNGKGVMDSSKYLTGFNKNRHERENLYHEPPFSFVLFSVHSVDFGMAPLGISDQSAAPNSTFPKT